MIVEKCEFDPRRDVTPVEQFGFVDLKNALDSGVVPTQLPDSDTDYNGMDNPEEIIGRPRDIFEAIDAQMVIESSGSAPASSEGDE